MTAETHNPRECDYHGKSVLENDGTVFPSKEQVKVDFMLNLDCIISFPNG